jgi:hypothetical protein
VSITTTQGPQHFVGTTTVVVGRGNRKAYNNMKMPKSYPLVFIVGVGCIVLNVLMLRWTPSTHSSVVGVARSLINRNGELNRHGFREEMDSDQPYFHLKVPFYIYEDTALYWANATVDGEVYTPPEPQAIGAE